MKTLELNRTFLKRPWTGLIVLFVILLLYELLSWGLNPDFKQSSYSFSNSVPAYLYNWLVGLYLPEFVSLYIVIVLIESYHSVLNVNELSLNTKDVLVYELKFLPLFLTAYFVFIPITLHTRFLLRRIS